MKTKKKKNGFKKIAFSVIAAVCVLASTSAISASAVQYETLDTTVNGKHVYAKAYRYNSYSKIDAKCYSGPIDIRIFMESQQKNSSGNWIYPTVTTAYSTSTSKSETINAKSGYTVQRTYGTVKFGGVGTYEMYKS